MSELDEAFDRVVVGTQKKSRIISEREKRTIAYHEAGHAIIGYYVRHADVIHKVTIVPRGRAGGYAMMIPKEGEDRLLQTKSELLDRVVGLLGGRVAEEMFIGEIGTGAYDDFRKATQIVRAMIMEYGMSDRLGPLQFGNNQGQVFLGRDIGHEQNYSDAIAYEIDQEMQSMIRSCYERAQKLLKEHEKEMHLLAEALLKYETLDKDQITELLETGKLKEEPVKFEESNGSGEGSKDVKVNIGQQASESDANKLDFDKEKKSSEEGEKPSVDEQAKPEKSEKPEEKKDDKDEEDPK